MPVYEYECAGCEKVFEVQQRMADGPLEICPECGGPVKKLISMSSFQLKGGGWYADGYSTTSGGNGKKSPSSSPSSPAPSSPPCQSGSEACKSCPAAN
ncbi:FmdB family zinc ribbon protein [Desulfogranum mediterraneum]|uniref:FmdB family zinc ribbon protein n=1 Tax=Desulfogranum mediterraneum TaxID=160661 RepID=UPI0004123E5C|nr:zinc ribbon domain-containing protein [Desulfogranum mediterraneum]